MGSKWNQLIDVHALFKSYTWDQDELRKTKDQWINGLSDPKKVWVCFEPR